MKRENISAAGAAGKTLERSAVFVDDKGAHFLVVVERTKSAPLVPTIPGVFAKMAFEVTGVIKVRRYPVFEFGDGVAH